MSGNRGAEAGRPLNSAIRSPKVAEVVARELRRRIIDGDLVDGDELPREAELIAEYGVSRPSLREALRILETERLIQIRRGKVGGAVVTSPKAASAAYHLGLTLRTNNVTLDDIATARLAIEPACAALAAARPDRDAVVEELLQLAEWSERTETSEEFTRATQQFHLRVTELCGSTTMVILAGALEVIWTSHALSHVDASVDADQGRWKVRRGLFAAHRRIIRAIAEGNGDKASREMRKHLLDSQSSALHTFSSTVIDPAAFEYMPRMV